MKQLFRLESFQKTILLLFLLGFVIGVLYGIYVFSPGTFRYYLVIPSIPAFFFILRGLYRNTSLFITDFKFISTKS
jgi:hypothetical protein